MRQKTSRFSSSSFDRDFARTDRTVRRTFGFVAVFAFVWMAALLAALGVGAYVAYHFLSKVW